jgi:hypothetical protein
MFRVIHLRFGKQRRLRTVKPPALCKLKTTAIYFASRKYSHQNIDNENFTSKFLQLSTANYEYKDKSCEIGKWSSQFFGFPFLPAEEIEDCFVEDILIKNVLLLLIMYLIHINYPLQIMVIYHYQATLKIAQMKYLFFRANENFEFAQMKKMIF